jgi:cation transport ATPase
MGRSPTGPEDMVRLIAVIGFFAALAPRDREQTRWYIYVVSLLLRGYMTFAFFFFVRSNRLAFFDGTKWWSNVHHPYFRVCLAIIAAACVENRAESIWRLYRAKRLTFILHVAFAALMWWAFAEMAMMPLYVSHDHIYLWVGTGVLGLYWTVGPLLSAWRNCRARK